MPRSTHPSTESRPAPRDPVIEAYKKDVDWTLIAENLRLIFEQRLANLQGMERFDQSVDQIRDQPRPLTNYFELFTLLATAKVDFIIVGGVAARLHGIARYTDDLDIVYSRAPENLEHIVGALKPYHPYPREAPPNLPFQWEAANLRNGLNFTLQTSLGKLDLIAELTGAGPYAALLPHTIPVTIGGVEYRCLDLDTLIQVKRAVGRPKDFEMIAELEVARDLHTSKTRSKAP